jgi:hypothetical protein
VNRRKKNNPVPLSACKSNSSNDLQIEPSKTYLEVHLQKNRGPKLELNSINDIHSGLYFEVDPLSVTMPHTSAPSQPRPSPALCSTFSASGRRCPSCTELPCAWSHGMRSRAHRLRASPARICSKAKTGDITEGPGGTVVWCSVRTVQELRPGLPASYSMAMRTPRPTTSPHARSTGSTSASSMVGRLVARFGSFWSAGAAACCSSVRFCR